MSSKDAEVDDLRPEYDLSELLKQGVQGKYVERLREGSNVVMLEPDVAQRFGSAAAVNEALRLVIQLSKLSSGSEDELQAQPGQ